MNDLTPSPSPAIRASAFAMRWLLRLLLALLLLMVSLWGALHYLIVPRISDFRPRIEAMAGSVIGVPVRMGQITAYSGGLIPSFELRDVQLLDTQGRTALALPRVLAALSWTSLLRLDFDQLYIDQPTLEIRRMADGRVFVAGLDVSSGPRGPDTPLADWFFSQREFVIRGATVRWVDEQRTAQALELGALDLVMRNGARSHELRLDATPPAGWGDRFQMVGKFRRPLDHLIRAMDQATTMEEFRDATRALDRVIMWSHWQIPELYSDLEPMSYWDKFGMPERRPLFFTADLPPNVDWQLAWPLTTWWIKDPALRAMPAK